MKINHLRTKFKPFFKEIVKPKPKTERNRSSRERYRNRRMKKFLKQQTDKGCNVINLSTHNLTKEQKYVLQLGHGFVPTPNHKDKEEELLILEGFRVTDRIHKLDARLIAKEQKEESEAQEMEDLFGDSTDFEFLGFSDDEEKPFERPTTIPHYLRYSQPKESQLNHPLTKKIHKDFEEFNNKIISNARKKNRKTKDFNLSRNAMTALKELKELIKNKVIDIRKVDKGQLILIIDYDQRLKIEEKNILSIAEKCKSQTSNWEENRKFVEKEMQKLFHLNFASRQELLAVTGLMAGGANGKLKTNSGGMKFTRATDSNELFAQQKTPYIYPLLKAHKVPLEDLKSIKPDEVHMKIPARLVVGMGSCQLSRLQSWLEHFLTPFSREYGIFEYTKDTTTILQCIQNTNKDIDEQHWNLQQAILFSIDVKALYPSV